MNKYIIYSNNEEVIISTIDEEHIILNEYFKEGSRQLDDYDRSESQGPVSIQPKLSVSNF